MARRRRSLNGLVALLLVMQALALPMPAAAVDNGIDGWLPPLYTGPPQVPADETHGELDTKGYLFDMDFSSPNDGWAVGHKLDAFSSPKTWFVHWDGSTWTEGVVNAEKLRLRGVSAVDTSHVWMVGDYGRIYFYNGATFTRQTSVYYLSGSTWVPMLLNTLNRLEYELHDVAFGDTQNGWAVGLNSRVFATTDGGVTWRLLPSPVVGGQSLNAVTAIDATHAVAVGDNGAVYKIEATSVSGEISGGTPNSLKGVWFNDRLHGWAVGDYATFQATSDGGNTWMSQPSTWPAGFTAENMFVNSVAFSDARTGVAVGRYQTVWRTTDAGATWRPARIPYGGWDQWFELRAAAFDPGDPSKVWAAGWDISSIANAKARIFRGTWDLTAPEAPSDLAVTAAEPGGPAAQLTWVDNASDETTYVVERAKDSTEPAAFSSLATIAADSGSYLDTTPDYTSRWYYRVRCLNRAGSSGMAGPSGMMLDTSPPSTTSNVSGGWYRAPVDVSLSATDSQSGVSSTERKVGDGGAWQAYAATFTVDAEGVTPVHFRSTDNAGNAEPTRTASVKIDSIAPTTTSDAAATYTTDAVINLTPTDAGSGAAATYWRIDDTAVTEGLVATTSVLGAHTLEYASVDVAGNRETTRVVAFAVAAPSGDPPVTTSNIDTAWHRSFDMTFSATDDGPGPLTTYYRLDGSAPTTYAAPVNIAAEPVHDVQYWSVDDLGIVEVAKSGQVRIDRTPPVTGDDAPASKEGTTVVTLTPTDGASGVERTRWRLDGGPATEGTTVVATTYTTHTLEYASTDRAGNTESTHTVQFTVTSPDHSPPTTLSNMDEDWHRSFVMTLSATDDYDAPGAIRSYYWLGGGGQNAYSGPVAFTTEGEHDVSYRSVDTAGNSEALKYGHVRVDATPPETTATAEVPESFAGSATVRFTAADGLSGVAGTSWWLDGGAEQSGTVAVTNTPGPHTLEYRSTDRAGNTEATRTVRFEVVGRKTQRVDGADRYAVAWNLAKIMYESGPTTHAIIASGLDAKAVDPLAAAGLSGIYRAPVLLVNGNTIPLATTNALKGMYAAAGRPITVHIVGGTASVPDSVRSRINNMAQANCTDRVWGADRYSNAAAIAKRVRDVLRASGESTPAACFVSNGEVSSYFFNALAVSPITARRHYPILLTKAGSLPTATRREAAYYSTRYVVGSTKAVASGGSPSGSIRIGNGSSRHEVARLVAEKALTERWLGNSRVAVANKMPDALTGGSVLGVFGGPMLFTESSYVPSPTRTYLQSHAADVGTCYVLGGTRSVTSTTLGSIGTILGF